MVHVCTEKKISIIYSVDKSVDNLATVSGRKACEMCQKFQNVVMKKCITCIAVHLNILCLIFVNLYHSWSYAEFMTDMMHVFKSIFIHRTVKWQHFVAQIVQGKIGYKLVVNLSAMFKYFLKMQQHPLWHFCLHSHVPNFIELKNWPPNCLNFNPVDYSV